MDKIKISSSIANFRDKILNRYSLAEYRFPQDIKRSVLFMGLYHTIDWLRFLVHRGRKTVFWAGGDIINLKQTSLWYKVIACLKAQHICENDVEKAVLKSLGIDARIQPIILDDPNKFNITFRPSTKPQVFVCSHPGYNEQYGVNMVEGIASVVPDVTFNIYGVEGNSHDNVKYHGLVSNERFNEEIKKYQAGLRLNDWDGFGEVLAKSVLLGQYPISRITYPYITFVQDTTDLINALNDLKNKKEPNLQAREYWLAEFNKPLL